jgi:regulator of sigma E protease
MLRAPATIKDNVGGTISITAATYRSVQQGLPSVFELAALLSISVGILNLLPVVPLDGGQMAMCFAELFRGGRRLSMKVQNTASLCGMAFIGMLIISVCFIDINRLFTNNQSSKPVPAKKANK